MTPLLPVHVGPHEFRGLETAEEIEQVHCLNYRTFVIEIPQHAPTSEGHLIDKFHAKNLYFGAFREHELVGMVSVHSQPPFSISDRLEDPSLLDRLSGKPLEVRLLAVHPSERGGMVFAGLGWQVYRFAKAEEYSHLLISGLVEREPMYQRLGFRAVGEPVGSDGAVFVPMILSLVDVPPSILRDIDRWEAWVSRIGAEYGLTRP